MKILIIGASGLVGGELYRLLKLKHKVSGTYNSQPEPQLVQCDITNREKTFQLITGFKPQVVIIAAYYADVDGCEKNPVWCEKINFDGIKNAVDGAIKVNAIPVFFSSDYIFDGKNGPYKEADKPRPLNIYGNCKLKIEEYIKKSADKYLIVRTCNVFGSERQGKNFVVKLIGKLKAGEHVKVVSDQSGSPTYAPNLAKAVGYLIENRETGIFHLSGKDTMTRLEFAYLIAKVFNLDKALISPVKTSELKQPARRPRLAGLNCSKARKILPFALLSANKALERMKQAEAGNGI